MSHRGVYFLKGKERSPLRALVSTQLKTEYGARGLSEKLGLGKHTRSVYLYLGLLIVAFGPIVALMYSFAGALAKQAVMMGQPGLPAVLAVTAGQSLVLFVGISGLMSILYYSDDLELLQAMPFTARQIMLAKVAVAYVADALVAAIVVVPFLVALGVELGSLTYWVPALLVALTVPGIPLALALLVVVLIMKATGRAKKRDLFRVIFGLVFFALIMVFQYLNMSITRYGPERMMEMIMQRNGLIQAVTGYYPPLKWAAWALTGDTAVSRLGGTVLFVGGSVAFLLAVSLVAQRWFFGGVSRSVSSVGGAVPKVAGSRSAPASLVSLNGNGRSPAMAVFFREHRMLTRTPNSFLVALTNLAIVPILLLVTSFSGGQAGFDMSMLRMMVPVDLLVLGAVGAHGLFVGMNQVSSSAISREGTMFWFSKAIPVSPKHQVRGKLLYGLAFAAVQLVVILATAGLMLRVDALHLGLIAVLGLLVSWPVSAICLLNDLAMPKLSWSNPQQAMKGNLGTLLAGVLSAAYLGVFFLLTKYTYPRVLNGWGLYGVVAVLMVITGVLLQKVLDSVAVLRYRKIEV